ncbi:uncharacterized protein CkIIalpha isoform X2 [Eurosta solidaginis]|uniref:uncharacterized protein CkIIalpha isoform X2 n=1 Tax=Eurosta solidaginis TaxID=178769 RepID=UPI0035305F7E
MPHYNLRSNNDEPADEQDNFYDSRSIEMESNNVNAQLQLMQNELQQLNIAYAQQANHRSNVQIVHVPKFNKVNPHIWFAQLERSFRLSNITDDIDMFDLVTINLDEDIILSIEDLVSAPPDKNRYVTRKLRLLDKYSESSECKLKRLLQGGAISGMKPSDILAYMKRLSPDPGCEPVIRTLFMNQMPLSIRPLLSVWQENDLTQLANIADKMLESADTNAVCAVSDLQQTTSDSVEALSRTASEGSRDRMQEVLENIRKLQADIKKLKEGTRGSRSPMRSPRRSGSTERVQGGKCYFHKKFGADARKCRPGCSNWNQPK